MTYVFILLLNENINLLKSTTQTFVLQFLYVNEVNTTVEVIKTL